MFQMFQWLLNPRSWNQNPFKALISLVVNKCLGLFLITLELSPNSPPRQTGIIAVVLRVCFSLFQLLGWGHVISSLMLPITPPGLSWISCPTLSWRLLPTEIYLWASWSVLNHVLYHLGIAFYVPCSSCCLRCQLCHTNPRSYLEQRSLTWGSNIGTDNSLSIISTLWWKQFELVSVPRK